MRRPDLRRSRARLDHRGHLRLARVDRRLLLEGGVGGAGDDARERRLAGAGRAVEDRRVRLACLDGRAKRGAFGEEVALPDELVQGARPHADGQRCLRGRNVARHLGVIGLIEQATFHPTRV